MIGWLRRHQVWLEYGFLTLLIMLPLLTPGYVQTFDMPWGPHIPPVSPSNNVWLLQTCLILLSKLLGSWLVQKLVLITLFILAGVGAHRLAALSPLIKAGTPALYVAGLLYIFNPFVYTRFMAGQWLVLAGYALLPWAIASLWHFLRAPGWRRLWQPALWISAIGLTSIHTLGFVSAAAVVLFVAAGRAQLRDRLRFSLPLLGLIIAVSAIWVVPLLFGTSYIRQQIGSFGPTQAETFASTGPIAGSVPLSTLSLEGFWGDPQGRYVVPSSLGSWWYAVALLIGLLIVTGLVQTIRRRDRLGFGLALLGLLGWWLAMGVGWRYSAPTAHWLMDHVPLFSGYREPHKWLMLLVLAYVYLAAIGTSTLSSLFAKSAAWWRPALVGTAAFLPLLLTPNLVWAAGSQLHSSRYPADWSAVNQRLQQDNHNAPVLVVPWHMYLPISFTGRVVANPARHFFTQPVITGDNLEIAGIPPRNSDALRRFINTDLLPNSNARNDAGQRLARYNVRYVILLKESDATAYSWLERQHDLRPVFDGPHIRLYKIEAR